jgi:hypothetical protein
MNLWRWDQGRLEYFLFDNLQAIATCLSGLDGIELNPKDIDPLRPVLESSTGLPFSPSHYRVWRNFARVFGCSLLATKAGKHLLVSEICHKIADGTIRDVDEYLTLLIQRFRFPSPVFESYDAHEQVVFPFIALLKYLLSKSKDNAYPNATVEDVFSVVIGNRCTGLEAEELYSKLKPTGLKSEGDQERQVREMMSVLSQFSFLKWANKKLYLDTSFDLQRFLNALQPYSFAPLSDRVEEFAKVTRLESIPKLSLPSREFETPVDLVFTEGKRSRITHLKIERSPLLRKIFFEKRPQVRCDMCELEPRKRYPWTDNLLEIHHLLPLSSGVAVTLSGTSLNDIVPLCPNCHRSVHIYYKIWLNGHQKPDFVGKSEAQTVYREAKQNVLT